MIIGVRKCPTGSPIIRPNIAKINIFFIAFLVKMAIKTAMIAMRIATATVTIIHIFSLFAIWMSVRRFFFADSPLTIISFFTFVKYELLANVFESALTTSGHQIHNGGMLFELFFRIAILWKATGHDKILFKNGVLFSSHPYNPLIFRRNKRRNDWKKS